MALFKRKYYQNYDVNGLPSTKVELTDDKCTFIHSLYGVDTNDGGRATPVKTFARASAIGKNYFCVIGEFTENLGTTQTGVSRLIFSDSNVRFKINGDLTYPSNIINPIIQDAIINGVVKNYLGSFFAIILNSILNNTQGSIGRTNSIIFNQRLNGCLYLNHNSTISGLIIGNHTIVNLTTSATSTVTTPYQNLILTNLVNLNSVQDYKFSHCLFRKATQWQFKGTVINITYGTENLLQDLKNGLTSYANTLPEGVDKTWLLNFAINGFVKTPEGLDTCVVHDDIDGVKIFNRYQNGTPVDYTLNTNPANPALTMASNGLHVGAYKPTISGFHYETLEDIDTNGIPTTNTPNMLVVDGKVITIDGTQTNQFWNRATSNIISVSRGLLFDGILSDYRTGVTKGFWFGKKQVRSASNGTRESVEIIPYDNPTTPSTFPMFSTSLNGTTKIFHKASDNTPLLYNELEGFGFTSDVDLSIYGGYAVTTVDSIILQNIEGDVRFVQRDINISYCKIQLNLHYSD